MYAVIRKQSGPLGLAVYSSKMTAIGEMAKRNVTYEVEHISGTAAVSLASYTTGMAAVLPHWSKGFFSL